MTSRSRNPEIYVKGYGKNITKDDLKSWFKQFGRIICIQYKGPYSFIQFQDYYDAQAAVKEMNDKKLQGYRLVVEPSGKKKNRSRSRSRSNSRRKSRYHHRSSSSYSSYSSSSRSSSSSSSSRSSQSSSSISNTESNNEQKAKANEQKAKANELKKALMNDLYKFVCQDTFLRIPLTDEAKKSILIKDMTTKYHFFFPFFLPFFFFFFFFFLFFSNFLKSSIIYLLAKTPNSISSNGLHSFMMLINLVADQLQSPFPSMLRQIKVEFFLKTSSIFQMTGISLDQPN